MTTRQISTELRPLLIGIQNPPISKKRWGIASALGFLGTGGVTYVSVKSFMSGAFSDGGILGVVSFLCAGGCAYCMYRFFDALRTRTIEPINSTVNDETARANIVMLRSIDNRLNAILNETAEIRVVSLDDTGLHESINQHLADLEQMLPGMRKELAELNELIQTAVDNRSIGSTNSSAYNSPSVDGSFEGKLLGRLTDLQKKVGRDQSSRSASRNPSAFSSPTVLSSNSRITSPTAGSDITPIKKTKLTFPPINDGYASDDSSKDK